MNKTLWLFNQRLSVSLSYCPMWEKPMYAIWNNGGRKPGECFDLGANLWRFAIAITLWRIGRWSGVLQLLSGKTR